MRACAHQRLIASGKLVRRIVLHFIAVKRERLNLTDKARHISFITLYSSQLLINLTYSVDNTMYQIVTI